MGHRGQNHNHSWKALHFYNFIKLPIPLVYMYMAILIVIFHIGEELPSYPPYFPLWESELSMPIPVWNVRFNICGTAPILRKVLTVPGYCTSSSVQPNLPASSIILLGSVPQVICIQRLSHTHSASTRSRSREITKRGVQWPGPVIGKLPQSKVCLYISLLSRYHQHELVYLVHILAPPSILLFALLHFRHSRHNRRNQAHPLPWHLSSGNGV